MDLENIADNEEPLDQPANNDGSSNGADEVEVGPDGLPIETKSQIQDEEVVEEESAPLRIRRFATIMNILNSLLGAGILSVPHAFSFSGVVPSIIMLVLMAVLSHIGTVLTMRLAQRENLDSLAELTEKILGRIGGIAIAISSMFFCISCMVSYLVIGFGTLVSWFDAGGISIDDQLWKRAIVVLIYSLLLPMAMTLPRNIRFLAPFSMATVFSIVLFMIAMIVKAIIRFPIPEGQKVEITIAKADLGLFSTISIYGLAFALPVVILPLIKPYNQDKRKRTIVSAWACAACFICVIVPGVIGYYMFGNQVSDVVLDDFSSKDPLIIIVRIGFFIVVTCSYPCIGQSLLASWSNLLFHDSDQGSLPFSKRWIVVLLTNIIPLAFAIFLPRAGPALSIGGAFGGCLVDFFFPALMWFVISKKRWFHWQNLLCLLFAAFGLVSCVIATYQAVLDAIDAFSE